MPVVMLLACVVVLVGVFFAATGRGGELSREHGDYPPLDLGPVSATDVALLRPPTALWGYNVQVTDEALDRIAHAMHDRDATITYLQQQLADVTQGTAQLPQITRDLPAQQVPYQSRPPAAGQPWTSEGYRTVPNPADSGYPPGQEGLAEEDLVPWDRPAVQQDRVPPDQPAVQQDRVPRDQPAVQQDGAPRDQPAVQQDRVPRDQPAVRAEPAGEAGSPAVGSGAGEVQGVQGTPPARADEEAPGAAEENR